ncbi:MAG: endonuclease/exonuclease/phosphatase family protein [Bacteroidia bacterium]|nr:endonuclease/exonuclease/phosphatase family protein [Bacteroidia bacterium]
METTATTPAESSAPPVKKRGWFVRVLLFLNWVAIFVLLASYLAPYVSPAIFWPLAFLGLIHPALIAVNLVFLLGWALLRRRQFIYPAAALLLGWPLNGRELQLRSENLAEPRNTFKFLSWNTKLFDLYNWSKNNETRNRMLELLHYEQPDVLCLQEFFNEDNGNFRNLDSVKRLLKMPYVHVEYTYTRRRDDHWGVATFSRFPVLNQGRIVFNNRSNNICIYTDLLIRRDTVRVYNMHLQSIHFGYDDYEFIEKVQSGEDAGNEMKASRNILRRLKRAYTKRAGQADAIAEHIANCRHAVIVCGDFNDTPVSYTYETLSNNLKDAFMVSGSGFGKTYENRTPFPRIDYILHSPVLQSFGFRTLRTKNMSDHYPVVCRFGYSVQ